MKLPMPAVYIETFGCQMNVADSTMVEELLAERGYSTVKNVLQADLIIVNTCSVRERAEHRAKTRIEEFARQKKKRQRLWVIGCMAQRAGDALKKEIPGIDLVIGAESLEYIASDIDTLLDQTCRPGSISRPDSGRITDFLPIMRGCDNFCAYCIVPYVRGREHSLPAQQLCDEARKMVSRGAREITLLGQNVNSYRDGSTDFADLIALLHAIDGLSRIRFTTSHPKDISDKLIDTIAGLPRVCRHIHLPVQSGSSTILGLMNRGYTAEHYLERIDAIQKRIPGVDITTDVMVGFPHETDRDFELTLDLFRQVRFTAAFMFAFSLRPGTKAAALKELVPEHVKKERLKILVDLQTEITKAHYAAMVGKRVEVLFTHKQERKSKAWMGQDYGCKRVLFYCQDTLAGTILTLPVVQSTGMTLIAERKKT